MGTPPTTNEAIMTTLRTYATVLSEGYGEATGATNETAKRCGISVDTVRRHRALARERGLSASPASKIELPVFPDEDVSTEQIIDHLSKRFEKRHASHKAHTWFKVKVKDRKPIGVLWVGDQHLGDSGCNLPMLRRHIEICKATDGMYAAALGDISNNWSGRLAHLYGNQETSRATERKLVEWLLLDSGMPWLLVLWGNHDAWSDGSALFAQMMKRYGTQKVVLHDWEARFSLAFPNGREFRIWAAHDFKGSSIYNPLHGPLKAAKFGKEAEIFVCGDKHNWGFFKYENADRGLTQTMIRVRGYKMDDDFSRRLGIVEQEGGCSILTVLDPETGQVQSFDDVELGARFLTFLREGVSTASVSAMPRLSRR